MTTPQGRSTLDRATGAGHLLPTRQLNSVFHHSNLDQIHPDADSELASLPLHPLIPVYPLGPGARV
jgi:hypothetical protein